MFYFWCSRFITTYFPRVYWRGDARWYYIPRSHLKDIVFSSRAQTGWIEFSSSPPEKGAVLFGIYDRGQQCRIVQTKRSYNGSLHTSTMHNSNTEGPTIWTVSFLYAHWDANWCYCWCFPPSNFRCMREIDTHTWLINNFPSPMTLPLSNTKLALGVLCTNLLPPLPLS